MTAARTPRRLVPRAGPAALVTVIVLVALAAGVAAGVWLTRPDLPASLDTVAVRSAPVSFRDLDDSRTVSVTVAAGTELELLAPESGRVTTAACEPGGVLTSGTNSFALDGAGLLSLATAVPPWRDLVVQDRGSDVAALNAELRRLGHDAPDSDRATAATLHAYQEAVLAAGLPATADRTRIAAADLLWLPAVEVTVGTCSAPLGSQVTESAPLVALDGAATASISPLPTDALPGDRVLLIDGVTPVPVDPDGQITDPGALATLLSSGGYTAAVADDAGNRILSMSWRLAQSVSVAVVPPAAVRGAGDATSCVIDTAGTIYPVSVVASELGQTFVTTAEGATSIPPDALLDLTEGSSCG